MSLAEKVRAGDLRAAARLLRFVDDNHPKAMEELSKLYTACNPVPLLGITGSPGAGKSTLINALITYYRSQKLKVGVVAVDPSSPLTGGALLGDRVRMQDHVLDTGVFIRSLANRGQLGGLSASVVASIVVLEGLGFDRIIVETVGIGQSEVDIARIAETTVVVMAPGLGDDVQALKAGSMEVADIFVVNKSDRPGATKTVREVEQQLRLLGQPHQADQWMPKVLKTNAVESEGIEDFVTAIEEHRAFLETSDLLKLRHRSRAQFELEAHLMNGIREAMLSRLGGAEGLKDAIERVAERKEDSHSLSRLLFERLN
ncbi:MAG: methylmalonyl Co-A mutase-associated GTPase MeaB [Myxococcota bacterium]|nr:methylmalonyl Co-A mutase-associated GTPase MeaB [Myxococcota bacterium]